MTHVEEPRDQQEVTQEHLVFLQQYVSEPIDLSRCDGFVGLFAEYDWQQLND